VTDTGARRRFKLCLAAATVCLAVALAARSTLTAQMSLHMLVQIPLLVLAGLLAYHAMPCNGAAVLRPESTHQRPWGWNEYGVPGLVLVSLAGAAWMIPKALDDALTDWRIALAKYAGLPVCGWLLGTSLRRAPAVVKLFFLGNFCWMSAIVGMTYLDLPVRLCNAYLVDDQVWTGRGLIALSMALALFWAANEAAKKRSCDTPLKKHRKHSSNQKSQL